MSSGEYFKDQHAFLKPDGDIIPDADVQNLPMPNEGRIARMHPHIKIETDEIAAQRHKEVPLTESEQALADALEQPEPIPDDVQHILDERNVYREELVAKGYAEDRINFLTSKKFGVRIARLAMQYDIIPYLGEGEDEPEDAEIYMLPQRNEQVEPEHERERDVRERQAGPDS